VYNNEAVDTWLKKVTQALRMLLSSMHTATGQLDQAVEEHPMTLCNPLGGHWQSSFLMGPGLASWCLQQDEFDDQEGHATDALRTLVSSSRFHCISCQHLSVGRQICRAGFQHDMTLHPSDTHIPHERQGI
jgi:hypothetical protein